MHKGGKLRHQLSMTSGKQSPTAQISDTMSHSERRPASSSSRDARAVRSGQALREALLALLARKPYDQITVRDICAEAGVHYATFFRHYQGREELLDAIARDRIAQLNAMTLAIRDSADYAAGFRALCAHVDENRALWKTLLNGGAGAAMREEWLRQSQIVAAQEPPISSWLPRELGTICAATLIAETLAWWLGQPEGAWPVERVAEILMRLLSFSVIAPE